VADKVLQELNLSQRSLRQNLLAEDIRDLLDSNALARLVVGRRTHNAVGALSQLFGHRVPLVDNEVLVEDFEDLTALQTLIAHADCCYRELLLQKIGTRTRWRVDSNELCVSRMAEFSSQPILKLINMREIRKVTDPAATQAFR
jgi:hypothetical protein